MNRLFLYLSYLIFLTSNGFGQCSSPANTILGYTKYCEGDKLVLKMSDTTQRNGSAWQTPSSEFFNTDSIVIYNVSELDKGIYYLYSGIGNCRKTTKVEVTIFKEGTNSNLLEIRELANNGNYCQGNLFKITATLRDKTLLNNFDTKIIYNEKDEIPFKIGDTLKTYNRGTYRVESKRKSCVFSSILLNINVNNQDRIDINNENIGYGKIKCENQSTIISAYGESNGTSWFKDGIKLDQYTNERSISVKNQGVYHFEKKFCDQNIVSKKISINNRDLGYAT